MNIHSYEKPKMWSLEKTGGAPIQIADQVLNLNVYIFMPMLHSVLIHGTHFQYLINGFSDPV
jgi:hypothetical protein